MEELDYGKDLLDVKMAIADMNSKLVELAEGLAAAQNTQKALCEIADVVKDMAAVSDLTVRLTALEEQQKQIVVESRAGMKENALTIRRLEESVAKAAAAERDQHSKSIADLKTALSKELASIKADSEKSAALLKSTFTTSIDRVRQDAEKIIASVKEDLSAELSRIKSDTEKRTAALKEEFKSGLSLLKTETDKRVSGLADDQDNRFKTLKAETEKRLENNVLKLQENISAIHMVHANLSESMNANEKRMIETEADVGVVAAALADLVQITVPAPDEEPAKVYEEEHCVFVRVDSAGRVVDIANEDTVGATSVFLGGNPWVKIDRGRGAKFDDPAANGYLEDGLADKDGVLLYCVRDGKLCKRSGAAVRKDRDVLPVRKKKGGKS